MEFVSQRGHLPDSGGEPWHPRGWEESPSNRVGSGGEWGDRRSGGGMGLVPMMAGWGRGEVPTPGEAHWPQGYQRGWGETLGGWEDWRGTQLVFPLPTWALGSLLGSQAWSSVLHGRLSPAPRPPSALSGHMGPKPRPCPRLNPLPA